MRAAAPRAGEGALLRHTAEVVVDRRSLVLAFVAPIAVLALVAWPAGAQPEGALRFEERRLGDAEPGAPLVLALHPWGSSGRAMARTIELARLPRAVRVIAPDGPFAYGRGRAWLPSRVAATEERVLAREAVRAAGQVAALVRAEREGGEPVLVTGISQGAVVAYALAARYPEIARAVVPAAGLLPEGIEVAPEGPRVVAVHGVLDAFVPFARARAGVERMRRAGRDVELRSLPDHGHPVRGRLRAAYFAALRAELAAIAAD